MKKLKLGLMVILSVCMIVSMESCKRCKGEDPGARVVNNGTSVASVQIKTSGGFTVNINNVDPGTASPYSNYAPGEITFTITVDSKEYVKTVQMDQCYNYDIVIDKDNNITSTSIERTR
jgi:hypothetical protein